MSMLPSNNNSGESAHPTHDSDPNPLLDALIRKMRLESDAALARRLEVSPPIIRMLREGKLTMSPSVLLGWVHETTGISVDDLHRWTQD